MLQMGDTVGPRYTGPKISAISYLFRTFSFLIMGDTERPRYTGFRGCSVYTPFLQREVTAEFLFRSLDNKALKIGSTQSQGEHFFSFKN